MPLSPKDVGLAYDDDQMRAEYEADFIIAYIDNFLVTTKPGLKMYFVILPHRLNWTINQYPKTLEKIIKAYLYNGWSKVSFTDFDRTISLYR